MRARPECRWRSSRCIRCIAADRACVNTMRQALDLCDRIDPARSGMLGVALDVYHVWWDFELMAQIERAGPSTACWPFTSATGWCRPPTSSTTAA